MSRIIQTLTGSPRVIILVLLGLLAAAAAATMLLAVPFDTIRASGETVASSWAIVATALGLPSAAFILFMFRDRFSSLFFEFLYRITDTIGGSWRGPRRADRNNPESEDSMARSRRQGMHSLASSFKEATSVLKKRRIAGRFSQKWLYQLPWYLFIGASGSGKTTVIDNSGLSFPLVGKRARGIGGSTSKQDLNWYFTDEAVLLDSAGHITADDDPQGDHGKWFTLLRLLKRYRGRLPLNGLIVAVAIDDLVSSGVEARLRSAATVRKRVSELYRRLGLRVPIYVLFTKSDLLAGFSEYFDDLDKEGRDAVFGITFRPTGSKQLGDPGEGASEVDMFPMEFDLLVQRLEERLLTRLQFETDIQRRARAFSLPQQLLSLKEALSDFLYEAFAPNTFDEPVILRGTYLVSGTRNGDPLDAVGDAVARTFQLEPGARAPVQRVNSGYFVNGLLRKVIFLESWLVEKDGHLERRVRRRHVAGISLITAAALALGALTYRDYLRQEALTARASTVIADFEAKAIALKLNSVVSGDLRAVAPLLDGLRDLRTEIDNTPRLWTFVEPVFLGRMVTLESETDQAYHRALNTILLPRLLYRLEGQLAARTNEPAFLYPGLHIYLMLGGDGTFAQEAIREWMVLDWSSQYNRPADEALRTALAAHLDTMMEGKLDRIGLDLSLIERTRTELRRTSVAQRVFNGVLNSREARALPLFDIAMHAGPSAGEIMQMRSGEPLSSSIPGLFTRDGFFKVYLPLLDRETDLAIKRNWILTDAKQRQPVAVPAMLEQVKSDAMGIYLQEFSFKWDQLINDISVKPILTLDDSLRMLNILAAPTSPIRLLVASVAQQTSLAPPQPPEREIPPDSNLVAGPANVETLFPVTEGTNSPQDIAARHTAQHFRYLQQLVRIPDNSGPNAQAPIDGAIAELGGLYRALTAIPQTATSPFDRSLPNALALQRVPAATANLPEPIRQWFSKVLKESSSLSIGDAKSKLADLWRAGPGKFCTTATTQRYPFVKNATQDIPLADFARLFAREGVTDEFFRRNIVPFMNATRTEDSTAVGIEQAALKQFEKAAVIREAMFQKSDKQPALDFQLSVQAMSATISNIALDIDGQRLLAAPRDTARMRVTWPAEEPKNLASLTVFPADGSQPVQFRATGTWALFRLMGMSTISRQARSGELVATFKSHGYEVVFTMAADRIDTPLNGVLLSEFRCPETF